VRWWALAVLFGCGGSQAGTEDSGAADVGHAPEDAGEAVDGGRSCAPVARGRIDLDELSGLVHSRTHDVLWAHNDSGDAPRFYALALDGTLLREHVLAGATHHDWEDLALGPDDTLWIGDVGDNAAREGRGGRADVQLYALPEPSPVAGAVLEHDDWRVVTLTYPDAPHDCEAVFVDPEDGALYLVTKEDEGDARLYRRAAPVTDGELSFVRTLDTGPPGRSAVTAADVAHDGSALLVHTYSSVYWWPRRADLPAAFDEERRTLPRGRGIQIESIAFARDGRSFFDCSEGRGSTLFEIPICE